MDSYSGMQDIAWTEQAAYSEVDIDELLKADETVGFEKCILFSIVVHRFG